MKLSTRITFKFPKIADTARYRNTVRSSFVGYIRSALTNAPNFKKIELDISQTVWLSTAEITMLACLIRHLAEILNTSCELIIATPENKGINIWVLESYRLPQLLGHPNQTEHWQRLVHIEGNEQIGRGRRNQEEFGRIIPLNYIDLATFYLPKSASDLYKKEPSFANQYIKPIVNLLRMHEFVSERVIDEFVYGVLRELAWNAVLHSSKGEMGGFAAFSGQIYKDTNELEFALVDLGCGVVANLKKNYLTEKESGRVTAFETKYKCTSNAATLRYAFEPESTSRTDFPAGYDRSSDRGLSLVSEIFREKGSLSLISGDSEINLDSKNASFFKLSERSQIVQGTSLLGSLPGELANKKESTHRVIPIDQLETSRIFSISQLLENSEYDHNFLMEKITESFVTQESSTPVLIDFGFTDPSARAVENLTADLISIHKFRLLRIANIKSSRTSPEMIAKHLPNWFLDSECRIELIFSDSLILIRASTQKEATENTIVERFSIERESICNLQFYVNREYVKRSFIMNPPGPGFYKGVIHLLSGQIVDRYFSVIEYIEGSKDREGKRWKNTFLNLINCASTFGEPEKLKVLGFSSSMRPIMNSLHARHALRGKSWYISSYDVPTSIEFISAINPGDEVILCTDVISTGTLIKSVIKEIGQIGAEIIAVVSLIDSRINSAVDWRSTFNTEAKSIPLLVGGNMNRTILNDPLPDAKHYWIDAVSASPTKLPQEYPFSAETIEHTLKLMITSGAVEIGHFVDGLRHASLRVDTRKMLDQKSEILSRTKEELVKALNDHRWGNFNPELMLAPAGLDRLHKLEISEEHQAHMQTSEIYGEIVRELISDPPTIVPIQRVYEPGGIARCAAIDYLEVSYCLRDLVIVDDGFSTGSTLRSLISQAVKSGAERILVIALLARTSMEDLEQWQLIQKMKHPMSEKSALVSVITPYILPIPFRYKLDCPQCMTISALDKRSDDIIEAGVKSLKSDLDLGKIHQPLGNPAIFVETWLRLQTLSELAKHSLSDFERLQSLISEIKLSKTIGYEARREAAVRLFLVEWQLLSRARLRQVISPSVLEIAAAQLDDCEAEELILDSLSLIRAMFPEDYVSVVQSRISKVSEFETVVDRIIVHLNSLDTKFGIGKDILIEEIISELRKIKSDSEQLRLERQTRSLEYLLSSSRTNLHSLDAAIKIVALKKALSNWAITHYVVPNLAEAGALSPSGIEEMTRNYFLLLAEAMEEEAIAKLNSHIYPLLIGLQQIVSRHLEHLEMSTAVPPDYFDLEAEGLNLKRDVESIRDSLKNYGDEIIGAQHLRRASQTANNVIQYCFEPGSPLIKVLDDLSGRSIETTISRLNSAFSGYLPDARITTEDVQHWKDGVVSSSTSILAPDYFVNEFIVLVKDNLKAHVLDQGISQSDIVIDISANVFSQAGKKYVIFSISNNGPKFDSKSNISLSSMSFIRKLKDIGARYTPAHETESKIGSVAKLTVRIME